jgi:crotonobetainyl-CoA:carnitine CoA-transferase CaiB-like acyl-CoA transferase
VRTAAPHAGEHTEAVLRELGLSAADVQTLRDKKIVG